MVSAVLPVLAVPLVIGKQGKIYHRIIKSVPCGGTFSEDLDITWKGLPAAEVGLSIGKAAASSGGTAITRATARGTLTSTSLSGALASADSTVGFGEQSGGPDAVATQAGPLFQSEKSFPTPTKR